MTRLQLRRALAVVLAGLALATTPVHAGKPDKDKGGHGNSSHGNGGQGKSGGNPSGSDYRHGDDSLNLSIGISVDNARRIAVETGATGYSSLPPGIRKNLARGKPLPPGIAKRAVPHDMLVRLPERPGCEWQVVGSDLVLVAVATAVVVDVLADVFD